MMKLSLSLMKSPQRFGDLICVLCRRNLHKRELKGGAAVMVIP